MRMLIPTLLLTSASAAMADGVRAETLAEAIAFAYQTNPTLQAARAQLRAVDEGYVQARSGYGPTVQIEAAATYNQDRLRNSFSGPTALPDSTDRSNRGTARVVVDQPLYSGGRTSLEMKEAEARIRSGRETLRASEQNIVFSVVQAYVDLRRDEQALAIRAENRAALELQLRETRARLTAGEVTRTDVAQAEAQLFAEDANIASAENQILASRAAYTAIIGHNPGSLEPEPPLYGIPTDANRAFDVARAASPELLQALLTERVSRTGIQIARAAGYPTVSVRGTYGYSATLSPLNDRNRDRSFTGQAVVTVPIFQSGLTTSRIRQAQEINTSDRLSIEAARRTMVQNVADAWNQMVTANSNIARQEAQVAAAALAYKGMKIEYRAGERSTLDVLIAEQTLRDAQLSRIAAIHDTYLAQALMLRYIGRLDARDIVEAIPSYDPSAHLRRIERRVQLPWQPLLRSIDAAVLPPPGQRSIEGPEEATDAQLAKPLDKVPTRTIGRFPTDPIPGTMSNVPVPAHQDCRPNETSRRC